MKWERFCELKHFCKRTLCVMFLQTEFLFSFCWIQTFFLLHEEGFFVGASSGLNVAAAVKVFNHWFFNNNELHLQRMLEKEQYKTKEDKRVFHPDFKHDTRVLNNPDTEMHLDFGIVPISTRLWTRASFISAWYFDFMALYIYTYFFFTGCRAARPWSRDYHMPVWHGSGRL